MSINFNLLKMAYNQSIDSLLSQDGLATECQLSYGVTKKNICPNCVFDSNLKKSANKYKTGGPIAFSLGRICPYCNGVGYYGEVIVENIFLAIIWDYKKWINNNIQIANPDGFIQTICDRTFLCRDAAYLSRYILDTCCPDVPLEVIVRTIRSSGTLYKSNSLNSRTGRKGRSS